MTKLVLTGSGSFYDRGDAIDLYGLRVPAEPGLLNVIRDTAIQVQEELENDRAFRGMEERDETASLPGFFADCGLPRVNRYPSFVTGFLVDWAGSYSLGSVGVSDVSLAQLLTEDTVIADAPILPRFLRPISYLLMRKTLIGRRVLANEPKFLNLLTLLGKLDWHDSDEWRQPSSGQWVKLHGESLSQYFVEFFSGRFVDRNGISIAPEFSLGELRFDQLEISPKLAGQIVALLIEFLFDRKFGVPFYSSKILATYRDYRSSQKSAVDTRTKIGSQETRLGSMDWSSLPNGTGNGTVPVLNGEARRAVHKLETLDRQLVDVLDKIDALIDAIQKIEAHHSDVQLAFTCFKTGVIREHLKCVFLNGQGTCSKDGNTGEFGKDYADLLGKIVAFAANNAEKQTRAVVGALIRGLSIASMNNEVLSEIIAASAGTLAKKTTEVATYRLMKRFIEDPSVMDEASKRAILDFLEGLHVLGRWEEGENAMVASAACRRRLYRPAAAGRNLPAFAELDGRG